MSNQTVQAAQQGTIAALDNAAAIIAAIRKTGYLRPFGAHDRNPLDIVTESMDSGVESAQQTALAVIDHIARLRTLYTRGWNEAIADYQAGKKLG